ncbi:hypothetical protein BHM03_00060623 [Ensete ventricosum]|nr:hypothetical protein BHM03_00060623 [Ensete ventricosum]
MEVFILNEDQSAILVALQSDLARGATQYGVLDLVLAIQHLAMRRKQRPVITNGGLFFAAKKARPVSITFVIIRPADARWFAGGEKTSLKSKQAEVRLRKRRIGHLMT